MGGILTNQQFLSLITVSPLLIWGIWILSEESFDGINSIDRGIEKFDVRVLKKIDSAFKDIKFLNHINQSKYHHESGLSDLRFRRVTVLPIYFLFLTTFVCGLYFLIFVQLHLLRPTLLFLIFFLLLFILIRRRRVTLERAQSQEFEAELPAQIQLLTVLISSGVSPARALALLATRSGSISSQRLSEVVVGIKAGQSVIEALDLLAERHPTLVLRRFITSLILGIERGSSLTPILIAQVKDARIASKSETLKRAGKAEIGLMIPVVFLILPVSILFALWPSYQQLGSFL